MARRKHPGAANNLDALCARYGIDTSRRVKHGALLDAELLAEVYIELIGGKQADFGLAAEAARGANPSAASSAGRARQRPEPLPSRLTEAERAAHAAFVGGMGDAAIWRAYGIGAPKG